MNLKTVFITLIFSCFIWTNNGIQCNAASEASFRKKEVTDKSFETLSGSMTEAWNVSWNRFYNRRTYQFYDYLSSYTEGRGLDHLPTAEEVGRQYPNYQGYDTGMEDCMISAGVMLCMITDKFAVMKDQKLKEQAFLVFQGIKQSVTAHGIPGFLARCVCTEDAKSIYINSSRDQYTHAVYGLWHYFHSPLSDPETKKDIREILSVVADRMIQNVTPENNYDFLRADGNPDARGISRMWNVKAHEAARLPMIYAAAWDVTNNAKYYDLYCQYIKPAICQSATFEESVPTYALLQMQSSLELLKAIEKNKELRTQMRKIMDGVAEKCTLRAKKADKDAQTLDLTMVGSDWRTGEGLNPKGPYRKVWYCIRESGEAALSQLMLGRKSFSEEQKVFLTRAITRLDYDHVSSSGIFYLQGAYWKARRLGILNRLD